MKTTLFILSFFSFLLSPLAIADESLVEKAKSLEMQSKAIQRSLYKEVVDGMSDGEKEAMSDKLDTQIQEAKSINSQLRNYFNNLDANAQRNILLRGSK